MATLSEIMTRDVFVATPDRSVAEVAGALLRGRFGSAVVTQGSVLLGILTERDVLRAAASQKDLNASPISEWMTNDPVTATPETTVDEAAEVMMSQGFRHLPVVEDSVVTGIVSLRDIMRTHIRRPRQPDA
jgi:CBS domain-containing protein